MQEIITAMLIPIVAIVEFVKHMFHLTGNAIIAVAFLVGGGTGAVFHYTQYPEITLAQMIIYGIIAGGISAGVFKGIRSITKKIGNGK